MGNHTGVSPHSPNKYLGPNVYLNSVVTRNREPTGADYRQPETGKLYPYCTFWIVGKDPTTGTQGDCWYLSKIVSNVAYWVQLGNGAAGPLLDINVDANTAPGTDPVVADGSGAVTITGAQVAAGTVGANVLRSNSVAANSFRMEIQRAAAAASATSSSNGVCHFASDHFDVDANGFVDAEVATSQATTGLPGAGIASFYNGQFAVDANGFVTLVGGSGPGVQKVNVDASTGPGTDPVLADGSGQIIVTGAQVASGTIGANAIRTNSLAANTYTVEIQRAASAASSSVNNAGISSYKSADFTIDSSGWVSNNYGPTNVPPGAFNLGFGYSAGTFSVQGADGTALSATNPGYVTLPSKVNPGRMVTIAVTANQTFVDDTGVSTIDTNSFGTVATTWTYDMPFFVYAVTDTTETAISFMITRVPHRTQSPIAGHIGKTGSALATESSRMFALGNPTVADYAETSCLCIGSFRMTKQTNTDWTVSALAATDGIGRFQEQIRFYMPPGQCGTAGYTPNANSLFFDNGGTAPHTTNVGIYTISRGGLVNYQVGCTCTQTGVGAVSLAAALPFFAFTSGGGLTAPGIATRQQSSVASAVRGFYQTLGDYYVTFVRGNDTTASCLNTDVAYIAPNGDQFKFGLTYHAVIGYV